MIDKEKIEHEKIVKKWGKTKNQVLRKLWS